MNNINYKEVSTDGASMVVLDVANNLSLAVKPATLAGTGLGLAIWQMWGKNYLKTNLQKLTLSQIVNEPASKIESTAEWDAELLLGLKGGIYTASIYGTNILMKGEDKMTLVDAILMGYGGSLGGAVVRTSLSKKA